MGERFQRRPDTEPSAPLPAAPQGEMDALLLGRTKELSTFDPDGRNWRGIFISLLVIAAVCSLILMAIIFLSPVPCNNSKNAKLTLDDLTSNRFVPYEFNVSWISSHELVYQDHEDSLILFNAETLTKTILLSNITFIFIYANDLYYVESVGSKAYHLSVSNNPYVFNGILNWFYREKVMETDQGLWWLADGSKLAYVVIDETLVNDTNYLYYGSTLYPKVLNMKYPRPAQDCLLTMAIKMCNWFKYFFAKLVEITAKAKHSWTEFIHSPILSVDGQNVFAILPRETTPLDSFRHVAVVPFKFQEKPTFVTYGASDVAELLANDAIGNLFFTKVLENRPEQKHVFSTSIRDRDGFLRQEPSESKCLTCTMDDCGVVDATFSPNAKYYILICRGPDVPKLEVWSVGHKEPLLILDSYSQIRTAWRRKSRPFVQHLRVPLQEQYNTIVKVLMPSKVEPEEGTKFPLLLFAERGLGGLSLNDFSIGLPEYFSASRHYFVAVMDGTFRGARLLGNRMLHSADFRVSDSGAEDIALVVRYLVKSFPFIDSSRVGIYSRGLAAFWTIRVLNDFYSPFACGATVAPLASWRFADALTSERYLGNPSSTAGQERYENAEFSNLLSLSNKRFLLMHGTADQDIPVFNSMLLMKKLASEGAKYRSQIYPDETHQLRGALRHFYQTLDDFFEQCFRVEVEDTSIHILPGFKKSKIMIVG